MSVLIGHSSISEKGTVNGVKGDSTKKEVCTRVWYNMSADYAAIHPDENVREKHAKAVEDSCANDNVGYGQRDRNTLNAEAKAVNYDISKIKKPCNCDCSSLQNVCAVASGAKGVTYDSNGWTTRSMKAKLKAAGYIIIEDPAYLTSAMYAVRGGIYVKAGVHTICALNNGSKYTQTLKKAGLTVTTPAPAPAPVVSEYYPAYTGTSSGIDTIFKAIGVPSQYIKDKSGESYAVRKPVAEANGIKDYKGTGAQNSQLKKLAREGKLKKVGVTTTTPAPTPAKPKTSYYPAYEGTSSGIDTIFKEIGVPAQYRGHYTKRKPVAEANGVKNYVGSSAQNGLLKALARQGKLKKV